MTKCVDCYVIVGIPGVKFDEAWPERIVKEIDGLQIMFISRTDLIAAKLAYSRPQDIIDAEALSQVDDKDN